MSKTYLKKTVTRAEALKILESYYRDYYGSWDSRELAEQMAKDTPYGVTAISTLSDQTVQDELNGDTNSCSCDEAPAEVDIIPTVYRCQRCGGLAYQFTIKN